MFEESEVVRLKSIQNKLHSIDAIVKRHGNITTALSDFEGQPAILMLFVAIAEQFNKLKKQNSKLLNIFDESDLKGIADTRTFIAHDYDGVNLSIIEAAIRAKLPTIRKLIDSFLVKNNL